MHTMGMQWGYTTINMRGLSENDVLTLLLAIYSLIILEISGIVGKHFFTQDHLGRFVTPRRQLVIFSRSAWVPAKGTVGFGRYITQIDPIEEQEKE